MKAGRFMFVGAAACVFGAMAYSPVASAGDLDDNISSYTESSISQDHEVGEPGVNVKFMILNAKSKAQAGKNSTTGTTNSANMNSVVLGVGSRIGGDIIIIDESQGSKYQVTR